MTPRQLHPRLSEGERRGLLRRGVTLFNEGRFFEAHEPWEEIWRSTDPEPRDLFQGLVQLAAGLYHWRERGKAAPAARLLARGLRRLRSLRPAALGIDLDALLTAVEPWQRWLEQRQGEEPSLPHIELCEDALVEK
jgi:predicted metal-dependent hydrolase